MNSHKTIVTQGTRELFGIVIAIVVSVSIVFFLSYIQDKITGWDSLGFALLSIPFLFLGVILAIVGFSRSMFFYSKTRNKNFALFLVTFAVILIIYLGNYVNLPG